MTHQTPQAAASEKAPTALDPYDPWMTPLGVKIKRKFYKGMLTGKAGAVAVGLVDWLAPMMSRRLLGAKAQSYPITTAQWILTQQTLEDPQSYLDQLMDCASSDAHHGCSWGLGFDWMSKNGLYESDMPFVTHTPYALEALIKLMDYPETRDQAREHFTRSWQFLENLLVMFDKEDMLALSYAPVEEPRIVINANSYACFSYALFSSQGINTELAQEKAIKLARWVLSQQQKDGSWHYYADTNPGNFIDCFHSCFVIKNLLKSAALIPALAPLIEQAVANGLAYLQSAFFDETHGLVRRFTDRDIKDPFVWDIYDQAEYLGLLILTDQKDRALALNKTIEATFCRRGNWYCKTDIFKRRWGKNFLRWGIYPYFYQQSKLQHWLAD